MTRRIDWLRWLPGLRTLHQYDAAWLQQDLFAGLVLASMLVPVGIAYAVASGLPGIYGLYATTIPLLAYALFGPSRILVLGPDSALAPIILSVVLSLSGGDARRAVVLASMMAIVSGIMCILAGVARLGFITELLSKPIRYGYMNGIALTVLISQLPKLFGFSIESQVHEYVRNSRLGWYGYPPGAKPAFYHTWLLQPRADSCLVVMEEAGVGEAVAQFRKADEGRMHRGHDLWLATLKWMSEGP